MIAAVDERRRKPQTTRPLRQAKNGWMKRLPPFASSSNPTTLRGVLPTRVLRAGLAAFARVARSSRIHCVLWSRLSQPRVYLRYASCSFRFTSCRSSAPPFVRRVRSWGGERRRLPSAWHLASASRSFFADILGACVEGEARAMRSGGRYGFRPSSQGRRRVGASEAPCSRQSAAPPFRAAQEIGLWRHLKGRSHAHWAAATRDARGS